MDLSARTLASRAVFHRRVGRSAAISVTLVIATPVVGTVGYAALAPVGWIDPFHQASFMHRFHIEDVAGND